MAILANAERLYVLSQSTISGVLEPSLPVRITDDVQLNIVCDAYRFAFHKLIERRTEIQNLLSAPDLIDLLGRSVAYQSGVFTPEKATTFAYEAIALFGKCQGHFMYLSEAADSPMSFVWKIQRDRELWQKFGGHQSDFSHLKRGLVWEFSTIKRLIAELGEKQPVATVVVAVDPQKEIRAEALAAVVAGGLAGMTQAAVSLPAGDRATEVMRSMFASDEKYYSWTAEDWVGHLGMTKPTVIGCAAWKERMQRREEKKQSAMAVMTAMQKAESSRRKQHKKLAE